MNMRVTILGSAAAEGWPGMWCCCDACQEARRRGGVNIRRRTAYLIDGDTLVDCGPDIYWQSVSFGIDLAQIRRIFFTHSHYDHLAPRELSWRRKGYSIYAGPVLDIFGNEAVRERILAELSCPPETASLALHPVEPGKSVQSGDIVAMPVRANHAPDEIPVNYVLQRGGKNILIGNDTGWWAEESWELVRQFKLDAAILECTYGHLDPDATAHHLGVDAMVRMRDRLADEGTLKPGARVVANHFSHNGMTLHEELCAYLLPHGIGVGYDGMILDL